MVMDSEMHCFDFQLFTFTFFLYRLNFLILLMMCVLATVSLLYKYEFYLNISNSYISFASPIESISAEYLCVQKPMSLNREFCASHSSISKMLLLCHLHLRGAS